MFRSSFCFSRRRQHTRWPRDWSSDVCSSDLQVGIDYKELPEDCQAGDLLLLDDGRVVLEVESINGPRVSCVTRIGGPLSNNKGINRQGGGLSAPALTEKDMADIKTAADIGVAYLAVSFPRSADDMNQIGR